MEFGGVMGLDGLVGASNGHQSGGGGGGSCFFTSVDNSSNINSEEANISQRGIFGGVLKHVRSAEADQEQQGFLKCSTGEATMQGTTKSSASAVPFLMRSNSHSDGIFSDGGEQMLSFSSHYPPSPYSSASAPSFYRNPGLASGSTNVSLHGLRGGFTPSQWMELEHQAMIYKYIDANIQIPSSLLIPIRRSTNTSAMSPFFSRSLRSTTLGWGPFHLGLYGNADPEPGRCRRTDGKKWRCSRDAVADQKYCERHINRGRHRSRKHVEGQTGAGVSGGGGSSNNALSIASDKSKSLQSNVTESSPAQTNRIQVSKEKTDDHVRDSNGISILANASPKPTGSFPVSKHHNSFEEAPSRSDFGLISSESLLNPLRTSNSADLDFDSSSELNSRHPQHHPLRHFIDDWPKRQTEKPALAWTRVEEMKSDRAQLSISVPSDLSSSSSSPNQEKLALSPFRLSREFNPMGGGNQHQATWIPISWEPTLGGPLGEVLNKTNIKPKDLSRNCSSLNLLTDGWDTSPRLSSSTGSSPRVESHKLHDSASPSGYLLGSTLVNLSTVPSLLASDTKNWKTS